MRQDREYGEELGFDFAGDKLTLRHNDGTSHTYCVCVMSWSASSLTYAELTPDQTTASICKAIGNALRFFKCRPYYLIIDNAKSMVIRHQKGREALLNNSFEHFMQSIGIEVRVATPRSPTQKSVVERAVYFTQERCLKRIDTTVPMNLEECNAKLLQLVEKYINNEKYKNSKLRTRRVLFDEHEFSKAQKALAEIPVYYEHIPLLKVGKDYSVTIKGIRRLVPYQLAGSEVSANIRGSVVELLQKGEIVAKFSLTEEPTVEEDMSKMPEAHHSVKEKRLKYPDADSIYEVSKQCSVSVTSFCQNIISIKGFERGKVACIKIINDFKKLSMPEQNYFDEAIKKVLQRDPSQWNSYNVDTEFKCICIKEKAKQEPRKNYGADPEYAHLRHVSLTEKE